MNEIALAFIKAREGCRLTSYQDSGGRWTVGYGATGPDITEGVIWTQEHADADLAKRVANIETVVSMKTAGMRLSERQAAALISFAYNAGLAAFGGSIVLQCVMHGEWIAAAKDFLEWDHVAGAESQGLLKRRLEEAALFLEGSS